ncbi:16605_t:CDS:1, partial [Gigaspora margarita]
MPGGILTHVNSSFTIDIIDSPQQQQRPLYASDYPQPIDRGKKLLQLQ